jgi:hypothetical protein
MLPYVTNTHLPLFFFFMGFVGAMRMEYIRWIIMKRGEERCFLMRFWKRKRVHENIDPAVGWNGVWDDDGCNN